MRIGMTGLLRWGFLLSRNHNLFSREPALFLEVLRQRPVLFLAFDGDLRCHSNHRFELFEAGEMLFQRGHEIKVGFSECAQPVYCDCHFHSLPHLMTLLYTKGSLPIYTLLSTNLAFAHAPKLFLAS